MRTSFLLIALMAATPAFAQSRVYGNADLGKPIAAPTRLSPEDAVRVLRDSHSIADLTDYRSPGRGPTIVVMGQSTTPWDWPAAAFDPIRPLGTFSDGSAFAPIGYGYAPYYATSYLGQSRHSAGAYTSTAAPPLGSVRTATPPPTSASAPRHVIVSSQPAGSRTRR